MSWFDLTKKEATEEDAAEDKRESKAQIKYNKIVMKSASSFMDIVDGELTEGVQYRIVTNQGFNAITVIEYLKNKYDFAEVYIAVYRMNLRSVQRIKEMLTNEDVNFVILLSSFFRDNKRYERWANDLMIHAESYKNLKIEFARNHAKVFLCKTKDGQHIVFEGSGNLSDNSRIEQYLIENNKTAYDFHKKWIDEIVENGGER